MRRLYLLSAVAVLTAMLPLATASPGLAQGPGPCTPPGNMAVGAAGPAMNGGQLMAGIGQCRPIASGIAPGYGYGGYRRTGRRAYYGGPGYGYAPGYGYESYGYAPY